MTFSSYFGNEFP